MIQTPNQSATKPRYNDEINEFLNHRDNNLQAAIETGCGEEECFYMMTLDTLEYQIRQFIAGYEYYLFQIIEDASRFISLNEAVARSLIKLSLSNLEEYIIKKRVVRVDGTLPRNPRPSTK